MGRFRCQLTLRELGLRRLATGGQKSGSEWKSLSLVDFLGVALMIVSWDLGGCLALTIPFWEVVIVVFVGSGPCRNFRSLSNHFCGLAMNCFITTALDSRDKEGRVGSILF